MSRLYLITGFLGAGKTTFLKQFMKQFSSERMHIIVNEFGKEGIDGELLCVVGTASKVKEEQERFLKVENLF